MADRSPFEQIAFVELGIETLAIRGRDALDFHDLHVACIAAALASAYALGLKRRQDTHDALTLARLALNTAPRFRVRDTDSYAIASLLEAALAAEGDRP